MAKKGQIIDLTGKRFNRLVVLSLDPTREKDGNTRWRCRCECGNEVTVSRMDLIGNHTKSCGCYRIEQAIKNVTENHYKKHGLYEHKLYFVWQAMKQRCFNKNDMGFRLYGGRGIKVCDEWKDDFKAFYDWAMSNGYQEGLEIDRYPDKNGNYESTNCRFTTSSEQKRNRNHYTRPFRLTPEEREKKYGRKRKAL